jgi:type IV pilus assembly protein PilQ
MKAHPQKNSGVLFLVPFALVLLAFATAIAEDTSEEPEQKEVLTLLQQRMQKKISVDFREMPIDDVIRIIAEQADVDIIKSPKVIGNVTTKLTDVPLEEALSNILAAHGYGYVTDETIIRVAPMEEISQAAEVLVSRIYRITYANIDEVEKALNKFKSPRGMVSSNPGTSNIIVTDTESKIKAIDTFVDEIDRITPQILVEVRIYDITSRDRLDLGIEWQAGTRTDYAALYGDNPSGDREPFTTGEFIADTAKTADAFSGNLHFGWLSNAVDIDAVLRAQKENIEAKLLANPRILVLDNESALFDIVREEPYAERQISAAGITETIKWKPIGVRLAVTPHVTRDSMLRLKITPEFGILVRKESFASGDIPVVDTRKVDTIALVKDGHTVVIGGLRKKDVSRQINKVPFLGDLPLVGFLFRFEGEDTTVNELVVFITPRIIEQPTVLTADEAHAYEATNFGGPRDTLTRAEKEFDKLME